MTAPINHDFKGSNGVANNMAQLGEVGSETIGIQRNPRLPSPQRGRRAGGEGDCQVVVGCLPFRVQPTTPTFIARSVLLPQTFCTPRGAEGAEVSIPLQPQLEQKGLSARSFGTKILVACLWMLFASTPTGLAQAKKTDKPVEQPASTKPQPAAERQSQIQKVFAVKHADAEAIARTLSIFPVPVHPNRELRVIGVSAPVGLMPTIEETIRRLDVPPAAPKNVELTVYLLLASDQESSSSSLPPDLESVAKQLMATFAFKGFRVVDTLVLRSRDKQSADVRGLAKLDPDIPNPSTYSLSHRGASILSDEKGHSIRLDDLRFKAQIGVKRQQAEGSAVIAFETIEAGFGTNVDVREGQKVVVGKAAVGGTNTALILVITAKILE